MNFRIQTILLFGLLAARAFSQEAITGKVVAEGSNEPLPAANVYWLGTTIGTTTIITTTGIMPPPARDRPG